VGLDEVWLLVGLGLLLGLAELLDQTHRLALETAVETTARTGVHDVTELVRGEVEQSERGLAMAPLCVLDMRGIWDSICVYDGREECRVIGMGSRTARGQRRGRRTCGTLSSS
jgi:hypothetical protein